MKRVRYIPQIQQAECGISVIAMMPDYYGAHYSLYDIREFAEIGRDGMSDANMVNIYDEITNMPIGLNTVVSEMGMNLSGGQRQRIVIARELIKHPSVLIMDEATCALDFVNEKQILERISKLNITIILVTHRLASIQNADKILFIDKGRIAEQGKHSELMDKQGKYYNMYSGK